MATKTEPKQERILLKTDKAPSKKNEKKKRCCRTYLAPQEDLKFRLAIYEKKKKTVFTEKRMR